ncbi:hypothetical protein D9M68_1005600 [compost metagenome]
MTSIATSIALMRSQNGGLRSVSPLKTQWAPPSALRIAKPQAGTVWTAGSTSISLGASLPSSRRCPTVIS